MIKSRFGLLDQVESIPLETKKRLKKKYNNDEQGGNNKKYIETTYSELKSLRNEGKLVPGTLYRITDYQCTTSQENTKSANHQFDIIVQAVSENILSEDAKAIQHKGIDETAKGKYTRYDSSNIKFVEYITINNITYAKYEGPGILDSVSHIISVLFDVNNIIFNEFDLIVNKYYFVPQFIKIDSEQYHVANSDADVISFNNDIRGYFYDSNLAAWELKYCIDNNEDRFIWAKNLYLSPVSHNKCIKVVADHNENYIYVRQTQLDNENGLAWVYSGVGDEKNIKEFSEINNINDELLNLEDIIYTNSENLYVGETINIQGTSLTIVDFSEEGRGVIYKMIDEYDNECPYDFKNIMFYRTGSTIRKIYNYFDVDNNIYLYTFSWIGDDYIYDLSILGQTLETDEGSREGVFGNIIKECSAIKLEYYKNEFCFALPNNVIISHFEYDDGYFYGCFGNILEYNCISNTFGDSCKYNKLGSESSNNIFGTNCRNNNFDCFCSNNNFGKDCYNNTFGVSCSNNIFGNNCYNNTFEASCYYNKFSDYCNNITFENNCRENEFGHDFMDVILENGCDSIRFGSSTLVHYVKNIKISAGCEHLWIYSNNDINATDNNRLRNVYIAQGIKGTYSNPVRISIPGRNLEYETKVAKDSHGDLQIYCEADLVN